MRFVVSISDYLRSSAVKIFVTFASSRSRQMSEFAGNTTPFTSPLSGGSCSLFLRAQLEDQVFAFNRLAHLDMKLRDDAIHRR